MRLDELELTPAPSKRAGPDNYCWWNGGIRYQPHGNPGWVFRTKETMAEQIREDYPDGTTPVISGEPATIGEGTVIGGDGFGWLKAKQGWKRWPHIGGVWFGFNVEIGSNVTIDRGSIGDTEISTGVKIDNGVQIGHGAWVGKNTLITAHAILGGSTQIGADCWIGLGAIIKEHVHIGDGVTIGMGAIVLQDVPDNEVWVGNPARKLR